MSEDRHAPPIVGMRLRDRRGFCATVTDVFPAGAYPGMILEWTGYNPSTDRVGTRGQAFTTKDWQNRWTVVEKSANH